MAFSVYGFYSSVAAQASPTYVNLTPLADTIATVNGNLLYVGALNNLVGALLFGTTADQSKVVTPSLLNISPYQIVNVPQSPLPVSTMSLAFTPASPFKLVTNEGLQVYSSNSNTSTASPTFALVALSDGALAPVTGEIITARATMTTSATADVWENAALSFDTVLPAGTYNLVGARVEGAHAKAFRMVFQGNTSVRPGSLAALGVNGNDVAGSRRGGWGVWGTFDQFTPPTVDHVADGTSETAVVYLDLIKAS